jgi:hypothetical protein
VILLLLLLPIGEAFPFGIWVGGSTDSLGGTTTSSTAAVAALGDNERCSNRCRRMVLAYRVAVVGDDAVVMTIAAAAAAVVVVGEDGTDAAVVVVLARLLLADDGKVVVVFAWLVVVVIVVGCWNNGCRSLSGEWILGAAIRFDNPALFCRITDDAVLVRFRTRPPVEDVGETTTRCCGSCWELPKFDRWLLLLCCGSGG